MMDTARELQFLEQIRRDLSEAQSIVDAREREFRDARGELTELRQIAEGLEARLRRRGVDVDAETPGTETEEEGDDRQLIAVRVTDGTPGEPDTKQYFRPVPRSLNRTKRPSLKKALEDLTADGRRRDVDTIVKELEATPGWADDMPKRVSITNRLNDLVREGHLHQVDRGIYELENPVAQWE